MQPSQEQVHSGIGPSLLQRVNFTGVIQRDQRKRKKFLIEYSRARVLSFFEGIICAFFGNVSPSVLVHGFGYALCTGRVRLGPALSTTLTSITNGLDYPTSGSWSERTLHSPNTNPLSHHIHPNLGLAD